MHLSLPPHAHISIFGNNWECDSGYRSTGSSCSAVEMPPHAHIDIFGNGWECDRGYRTAGAACVAFQVPENAHLDASGHGWDCNSDYKAQGDNCVRMTQEEAAAARLAIQVAIQRLQQTRRALDSVDWSSCNDSLDRLRRASRDAAGGTRQVVER